MKVPRRLGALVRPVLGPIVATALAGAPLATWMRQLVASAGLEELRWPLLVLTHAFSGTLRMTVATTMFLAMLLFPLGGLARMVARARVRAGLPDHLARLRAFVTDRKRTVQAVLVGVVVLWSALLARRFHNGDMLALGSAHLLASLVGGWAQIAVMRAGLAKLVAPTLGEGEAASTPKPRAGITYDAVARSGEARAAVAAVFVLSAIMFGVVGTLPISTLLHDRRVAVAVSGYVVLVLAAAFGFRSASRAAIGIDGVRVYGTSRTRFFAYRDLDAVRASGVALQLLRKGRVVLALELHGEDAARQGEVREMIEGAIARAAVEKTSSEQTMVASSSSRDLVRGAVGASDYRMPAMSREQLWAVVESAAGDAKTRMTAIEALAKTGDETDRERLRVAFTQCAEPSLRVAARDLDAMRGDEEPEAEPRRLALRR